MKIQTLLTLALAAVISATTGCRNPKAIHSTLPGTSMSGSGLALTPGDGHRLTASDDASQVAGGTAATELANDADLLGRDLDRSAFANETVYFDYDRSTVRTDEASKIEQVAGAFKTKGADFALLLEGHCDERGTEEYNRALGESRALRIRELLMNSGVEGKRIFTRSFGKDQPASVGHDETVWSKNRRGEFVLVLPKKFITTQNTQ
jgi:outer membrane protein OmpA-like peptidoglycan-associated protein